jgi:hypothetical protein
MVTTKNTFSFTDTQIGIIKSALRTRIMHINDMIKILSANQKPESKLIIDEYDIERRQIDVLISDIILH